MGLIFSLTIAFVFAAYASADHNIHHRHTSLHHRSHGNATSNDTATIVKDTLAALAKVNKDRTSNPNFNNLAFDKSQGAKKNSKLAATPLDYSPKAVKSPHLIHRNATATPSSGNKAYSIPTELARAARIVAESTPNKPTGNHSLVASQFRNKYGKGRRDTNAPSQALVHSNSLSDFLSTGTTNNIVFSNDTTYGAIQKRASTSKY